MESDQSYYRRRALEEQFAAKRATCAAARDRHEEVADMYRLRVEMLTAPTPDLRHILVGSTEAVNGEVDLLAD